MMVHRSEEIWRHGVEGTMDVNALMTTGPITTSPDTPVLEARQLMVDKRIRHLLVSEGPRLVGVINAREAARLMLDHKIGALPVVDGGRLVGSVTETDLRRAFVKAS
jgi:CBS domain-containing protein